MGAPSGLRDLTDKQLSGGFDRIETEYADAYDKICPVTCGDLPRSEVLNGIAAGRNALHARRISCPKKI